MKTIGFVISGKENEKRRALLPYDILKINNKEKLFFERGYGKVLGISDEEYLRTGVNLVPREVAYQQEIICNPKAPEPNEKNFLRKGQTLFGWIHAVQGRAITDFLLQKTMSAIAWENMFEDGLHSFWRNNEIAGEAAVLHAVSFCGKQLKDCKVALIGHGNCARGAFRTLSQLGADVFVYERKIIHRLRTELNCYDIIINAVLWDVFDSHHLIYREDLVKMKPGSMIIDISCDEGMGIETSRATTIENPVYEVDGILHYVVDHTPALLYKTATTAISSVVCRFVDALVEGTENSVLKQATVIADGNILDEKITRFQKR